jgi:ribosomal protein S18 acetylase RimI-like enzyme
MSITFRPCTAADVDLVVPLIYSSGPAAFRYVFSHSHKEQAMEFLRYAFVSGSGEFGYQHHIAVLHHDQLVATGGLLEQRHRRKDFIAVAGQILRFYRLASLAVMRRGTTTEAVIPPPAKGVAVLAHLGVEPGQQGRGIGARLITHLLHQAQSSGYTRAGLDVADSNLRAQKLYQGMGFRVLHTHPSMARSAYGELGTHHYMERAIAPAIARADDRFVDLAP